MDMCINIDAGVIGWCVFFTLVTICYLATVYIMNRR